MIAITTNVKQTKPHPNYMYLPAGKMIMNVNFLGGTSWKCDKALRHILLQERPISVWGDSSATRC